MNIRSSLLLVAVLAATALTANAQYGPPPGGPGGHAGPDSPLEIQMKILARGKRQLTGQIADPTKQQDTVTLIETLKKASVDSKALDPRKTSTVPAADQEKFLAAYRAQMDKLTDAFNQIEEAVKTGQYDKAKSLLGNLQSIAKEGHRDFKQD